MVARTAMSAMGRRPGCLGRGREKLLTENAAGFQSLSRFSEQFRRRDLPSPGKWRQSGGAGES
jgi:hypothetical protein